MDLTNRDAILRARMPDVANDWGSDYVGEAEEKDERCGIAYKGRTVRLPDEPRRPGGIKRKAVTTMEQTKKYEFTGEMRVEPDGTVLHRIRALRDFGNVKAGEMGGWVESEKNLDQHGNAWVYENAVVCGDAMVYGDARVHGRAQICGYAHVSEHAEISGNACVHGYARVFGHACVLGNAEVYNRASVYGGAYIRGAASVFGKAMVYGDITVRGNARVSGSAAVSRAGDYAIVDRFGREYRATTFFRRKDGSVGVQCGCFYGGLQEFREQVRETHGNSKLAKEYLVIADLMELHFTEEGGT